MANYNFLNLSPIDFEELSRDLLQKHLNLTLESFTEGRDGGIDLRYLKSNTNIVIQCKRYKDFNFLFSNLKKETVKLKQIKPTRYIISTSVGLTPEQKDKIYTLFQGYIQEKSDIFGKDDLNNLISQFPEIEKNHFKLWLSSINILEKILYSKIYNYSNFEKEEIENTLKVYVKNESYNNALHILKEKKYVIISGIPGIGKTTLARVLVYYFLSLHDFDEFIYISKIDDATKIFSESKKQVFLFDDFLGSNFFEVKLLTNEDKNILNFMKQISRSNNKVLIFTTREYILAQAKQYYEIFNNTHLELSKCIIDLSQYTRFVKAKILYNHLFFKEINKEYLKPLLMNNNYLQIINHPNYNPRIIETILDTIQLSAIEPSKFLSYFIQSLDNPTSVWKHTFENQISNLSKYILANLLTTGTPIPLENLQKLIQNFTHHYGTKYNIKCSDIEFKKAISELENTFIKTSKGVHDKLIVEYQNPSIQDFLVNYFKDLYDSIGDIINSALYLHQLFYIFSSDSNQKNKIPIRNNNLKQILIVTLIENFNGLVLYKKTIIYNMPFNSYSKSRSDYAKLSLILNSSLFNDNKIKDFVFEQFKKIVIPLNLEDDEQYSYFNLLNAFSSDPFFKNELIIRIISFFFKKIQCLEDIENFQQFEDIFPSEYHDFIKTHESLLHEQFNNIIAEVLYIYEDTVLEDIKSIVKDIGKKFDLDCKHIVEKMEERMAIYNDMQQDNDWEEENENKNNNFNKLNEEDEMKSMFASLINSD